MNREDSAPQILRLRDALERVTDGVATADADGRCVYVNGPAAALLGRTRTELEGASVADAFGNDTAGEYLAVATETGEAVRFEHHDAERDRRLAVRAYPHEGGLSLYLTDVTDRRRGERDRHWGNLLSTLVEHVSEAVYVKDTEGHYEFVNGAAAALFGRAPADVVGAHDEELFDAESAAAIRAVDDRVVERNAPDRREAVRSIDGETHVFLDEKYPAHDEAGTVVGIVGISRDVTERWERERELERQEYLFDSAQELADIGVWEIDPETEALRWSDGVRAVHGVDASYEPTVAEALDFYHPDDREMITDAVEEALDHGGRYDLDLRIVRPDGAVRDVLTHGEMVPGDESDGEVLRGVVQDITERKERERELERFRAFVEHSSDAISLVDETGTVQYISSVTQREAGIAPERFVGTDASEFVHPDDRAEVEAAFQRVLADPDAKQTVQYRGRQADGSWVWVESVFTNHLDNDDIEGVVVVTRDVTERKRHEAERTALAGEYEAVFENADDGIFLVDVETGEDDADPVFRYSRLNPSHEARTGLTTDAVKGRTPRDVLGDDLGDAAEAYYRRCVETRSTVTYDDSFTIRDRAGVWQTRLAPVVVDGAVRRVVGIARDVTERVEYERELRRKNARLDEFASVISHDIRNPLGVALGRVRLLEEESDSEHVAPIVRSLIRIEAIVDDTLTLARQGETVAETEPISLTSLVGQCWGTVDTTDATLTVDDEFVVRGDRERLRHVFENLFSNSVQHGGPDVTVRVGRLGDDGIYVEDDGPGIPAAERETVFDPGHRSAAGGTGFGLTIVRRIVEAHGWTVEAAESETGGARFEFADVDVVA